MPDDGASRAFSVVDKTDLSLILSASGLLVGTAALLVTAGAGQFVAGLLTGLLLAVLAWLLLGDHARGDS